MILTIEGKMASGKTTLAREICRGKNVISINEYALKSAFWAHQIDEDTDFIVVDDVTNYESTYSTFKKEFLTIHRKGKESLSIKMPNVILIRQSEDKNVNRKNLTLKIFELRWTSQDEKEWVAAHTVIEALKVYCSITGMDLIDMEADDDIVEVPESQWADLKVRNSDFDEDEPEDEINFREMTFQRWMEIHSEPNIIAGTNYE